MMMKKNERLETRLRPLAIAAALMSAGHAEAMRLGDDPDVEMHWDNTVSYNVGARARGIDSRIGNNPVFQSSDYKFDHAGDIITNRVSLLSEFDVSVRGKYGLRVSASAWKDFAYDDRFESNPGYLVPGAVPYSALSASSTGRYSSYTRKYYMQGTDLLDAFVFSNFNVGERPASLKFGRVNIYWGNALFAAFQGISYSQGPVDAIKASASPGTSVKELFLPRTQLTGQVQLNDQWSLAGQYFLEYRPNRLPEGGTFDGAADFLFRGPDLLQGPTGAVPRGRDLMPKDNNGNFGLSLRWTPPALGGNLGLYVRQFDEVMPWAPLVGVGPGGPEYHLAYAKKTKLVGLSLDMGIGPVSTGFEISYRKDTALNSSAGPLPTNLAGTEGARGDVLNLVANGLYSLPRSPVWDTGTLIVEMAATRVLRVTSNASLYNGVGYAGCTGSKADGCSTKNAVSVTVQFTPQWLQVMPGLDVDMPITFGYGLYGNPGIVGAGGPGGAERSKNFSIGVHGVYLSKYNVTLAYSGSRARTTGLTSLPNGTSIYAGGNGPFMLNDRDRISLTLQAAF